MAEMLDLSVRMCERVVHYLIPNITHEELRFLSDNWWKRSKYHYPNFHREFKEFLIGLLTIWTKSNDEANALFSCVKASVKRGLIRVVREYRVRRYSQAPPAV